MTRILLSAALLCAPCQATAAAGADPAPVVDQVVAALCDKRVAVLAELPSHGERVAFRIKADVARELVQRCGFHAIVLEAPIYDFIGVEPNWGTGRATQLALDNAIGRFWMSGDLLGWRKWLFGEADAGRLVVGGLDDQVSVTSEYARATLPGLIASRTDGEIADACRVTIDRNLRWSYDVVHPFDGAEKSRLHACAQSGLGVAREAPLTSAITPEDLLAGNLASYVARQTDAASARSRDEVMFHNALWYIDRLPREARVVIWTATVHGARQQGNLKTAPMGAKLHARLGAGFGAVGFTAFGGQSARAGNPPKALEPAAPGSLEEQAVRSRGDEFYLDQDRLKRLGVVESRLFGSFTALDWSSLFDGVVVIREEQAPDSKAPQVRPTRSRNTRR